MIWLLVALSGAIGSVMRYGVARLAVSYWGESTVMGTLIVNVSGSFALGLFITVALEKASVPAEYRTLVAVGFLGGYTTFSALSFEAVRLVESGEMVRAGASVAANIVVGLAAAYLGILAGRSF